MKEKIQVIGKGHNVYDKWQEAIFQCKMMNSYLEKYIKSEFQTQEKTIALDRYRYCFNAFVNACRAVTFILQKVYSKKDGFAEWYPDKQAVLRENAFANLLWKLRTFNQKEGNDYPQINVSFKINKDFQFSSTMSGVPVKEHEDKRIPTNVVDASFEEIERTPEEIIAAGDVIEMDFPEGATLDEIAQLAAPVLIQQYFEEKHKKMEKLKEGIMERTDFKYRIVLDEKTSLTVEEFKSNCFDYLKLLGSICGEAQQKFESTLA